MKNDSYETMINKLREVQPEAYSQEELTNSILANIESLRYKKLSGIIIDASERQWTVFCNFRTLMAAAALFLIGFFIYQQYELTDKINRLETEFISSKQSKDYENQNYSGINHLQKLFENPELVEKVKLNENIQKNDLLTINRKSLNYLLNAINELKRENTSIRERLLKYYSDSAARKN